MEYNRQYVVRLKQSEINRINFQDFYIETIKKTKYYNKKEKLAIIKEYLRARANHEDRPIYHLFTT